MRIQCSLTTDRRGRGFDVAGSAHPLLPREYGGANTGNSMIDAALPAGLTSRPATLDDVERAAALANYTAREFTGADKTTAEDLRVEWTSPALTLATDTRLVCNSSGDAVAFEEVYCRPPYVMQRAWGAVHPEYRGRGIGTALLQWAEQRARQHVPSATPGARVVLNVGVNADDNPGQELLADNGHTVARHFLRMTIDLDAPPPPPLWPPDISVRTFVLGVDDRAALKCTDDAFRDHWGWVESDFDEHLREFQHWLTTRPDFDESLFWLAEHAGKIVGACFAWPTHEGDSDLAYIAVLCVLRSYRRRGIARALLLHAFGEFHRRGKPRVCLGVDAASLTGATTLYEAVGMRTTRRFMLYEKELRPGTRTTTDSLDD